jgi:hypothetical protein
MQTVSLLLLRGVISVSDENNIIDGALLSLEEWAPPPDEHEAAQRPARTSQPDARRVAHDFLEAFLIALRKVQGD